MTDEEAEAFYDAVINGETTSCMINGHDYVWQYKTTDDTNLYMCEDCGDCYEE